MPSIKHMHTAATTAFRKPDLPAFRRLQGAAILVAACWLFGGGLVGYTLVERFIAGELERQQKAVQQQADILARLVNQELGAADKLAVALSQDTTIINHQKRVNALAHQMSGMTSNERKAYLEQYTSTEPANAQITRLLSNIDMMSVFVLDAAGNCIATAYTQIEGNKVEVGCLGENYRDRRYYNQAKNTGRGHQFAVGKRVPLPSLFFARASQSQGKFLGASVVRLDANELVNDAPLSTGKTWIVDGNGVIISSSQPSHLLKQLGAEQYPPVADDLGANIYRRTAMEKVPLTQTDDYPQQWRLWETSENQLFVATALVGNFDFKVWHGVSAENFFHLYYRSWIFMATLLALGLTIILIIERVMDAQHRRMAHLQALADAHQSLEHLSHQLFDIAITDDLTQLSSRLYFYQRLEEEIARANREGKSLALLQLDIDNFKTINDNYGHPAGDEVIRTAAKICRDHTRKADLLGRIGGEEFSIGLLDCDRATAESIAENIRSAFANKVLVHESRDIRFTCSIGVAMLEPEQQSSGLIRAADNALYNAKGAGRNQIQVAG